MKTKLTLCLFAVAATTVALQGQTVFWGGPVWGEHLESDGITELTSAGYTFQIGAFDPGFDPTTTAIEDWSAAWHVFDTSVYDDTNMFFDGKASLDANGISNGTDADISFDFRNQQLYIWVYDDNTFSQPYSSNECHEWALLTGNWTLPATADQTTLPFEWRIDTATTAYVGQFDPDGNGINPISGSIGTFTSPTGAFDLQTATVCAIPEPSAALLGLLGTGMLLVRRKRQA